MNCSIWCVCDVVSRNKNFAIFCLDFGCSDQSVRAAECANSSLFQMNLWWWFGGEFVDRFTMIFLPLLNFDNDPRSKERPFNVATVKEGLNYRADGEDLGKGSQNNERLDAKC